MFTITLGKNYPLLGETKVSPNIVNKCEFTNTKVMEVRHNKYRAYASKI